MDADLAMIGATAIDPSVVVAQYQVVDQPILSDVPLTVYRSADPMLDPGDVSVGQVTLTGTDLSVGPHTATVPLSGPLAINPALKYVLVVAEAGDVDASNDLASFRKWVVGVATHGVEQPSGYFPAWVTDLANGMRGQGYDEVLAYDWSDLSGLPSAQAPALASQRLAGELGQVIAALPGFAVGDTVDIHLVGHSRGGGMITQTAALLPTDVAPLQGGYLKLSLLDPHPTNNTVPPNFSVSTGPIGLYTGGLFVMFQSLANDPALAIPANVDTAEVFYQHANIVDALGPDEQVLNSWGVVPAGGKAEGTFYYDVTAMVPSHYGVHQMYLQVVVPTLGVGAPVPIPPVPTPEPPTGGGAAFPDAQTGARYEQALLDQAGVPRHTGSHLLRGYNTLNQYIARGRTRAISHQITKLERFLLRRRDRTIPALVADNLLLTLQQGRALLLNGVPETPLPRVPGQRIAVRMR